jgi:hypothetical protein
MLLKVQILEGRGFDAEPQALVCCAVFGGAAKSTAYSVAASHHAWHRCLRVFEWACVARVLLRTSPRRRRRACLTYTRACLRLAFCTAPTARSTLSWEVGREELRCATSDTNHCKISVLRRDGACLGWAVISLRSAKLQGQYKSDPQGACVSACPGCVWQTTADWLRMNGRLMGG